MSEITVTAENFADEVLHSQVPVLLDFWATWCGPCRMLAPVLEEIARETEGAVKVGKVNVDEQPALADAFNISGIPTVVLFKDGRAVRQSVGYRPKEELLALLAEQDS